MGTYERTLIKELQEGQRTVLERLLAVEKVIYGIATDIQEDGDLDLVVEAPGNPPVLHLSPEPLWEQATADLTDKQRAALKAAGLDTITALREAAQEEDGFTRIDGLGTVADGKLRNALEELK